MGRSGHLVYLGADQAPLMGLVYDELDSDATVSVVRSTAAAIDQYRQTGADCLVVDREFVEGEVGVFVDRLSAVIPNADVVVRASGEGALEIDDVPVLPADASVGERAACLGDRLDSPSDVESTPSTVDPGGADTFTGSLQGTEPSGGSDRPVAPDGLTDSLENTPTVVDTFLNNIVDIFFVFDLDLNFRLWNDSFNDVLGYTDAEIASMSPLEVIVEDDHERTLERIGEIVERGQATAELDVRTSDGRVLPYSFTGSLIENESGTYISGIGRDISERKARERQLRRERDLTDRVIETSPIALFVMDADGTILQANSRATNVLGITQSDMAPNVDESDWRLYDKSGDELPAEDHPIARALETGETVYGANHLAKMPDGEEKWISKNAAPLTDEDGNVSRVVVAIEDVTEIKEREQELKRRKAELTRSNAELERFAYVASHDLKEPLRMISNYLGLLERRYGDELDEDARDFIGYATDGAERMRELINGLLKYSRTQRHDDAFTPVDTEAVVETVCSNLTVALDEADAEVRTGSLPTVTGDRNHLVQLFQNLVSNAVTHGGGTAPTVRIEAEREGDRHRFAVADDGDGIDPDEIDRLFEIFYSGTESDSTGIGLAICQKIVDNHGGRIWVESEPGDGTTVYFTLPAESAQVPGPGQSLTTAGN